MVIQKTLQPQQNQKTGIFYALLLNPAFVLCILVLMLAAILNRFAMEVDTGIWNYVSRMWLYHGIPPYTGSVENKTPGIFYIFYLSNRLFGLNLWFPRLFALCAIAATAIMMYFIGKRIYGKRCGHIALSLFGLMCCQEGIIGFSVTTEMFMVSFSTAAILVLSYAANAQSAGKYTARVLLCGFLMGCAISFKQIALLSTASVFLFYLWLPDKLSSRYKNMLKDGCLFWVGVIAGITLFLIPVLLGGTRPANIWECVWQMLAYSGRFVDSMRIIAFFRECFRPELNFLYAFFICFCLQAKPICRKSIPFWSIVGWAAIDIFAIHAPGTYFHHHFLQLMPSITIAVSIVFTLFLESNRFSDSERSKRTAQLILAGFIIFTPYRPLLDFTLNKPQINEHISLTGLKELGLWLKDHTTPDDYIYTLARPAGILMTYSERRSPSRHFTRMFVHIDYIKEELLRNLTAKMPKYIIFKPRRTESEKSQWFLDFLYPNYAHVKTAYGYDVYEKNDMHEIE